MATQRKPHYNGRLMWGEKRRDKQNEHSPTKRSGTVERLQTATWLVKVRNHSTGGIYVHTSQKSRGGNEWQWPVVCLSFVLDDYILCLHKAQFCYEKCILHWSVKLKKKPNSSQWSPKSFCRHSGLFWSPFRAPLGLRIVDAHIMHEFLFTTIAKPSRVIKELRSPGRYCLPHSSLIRPHKTVQPHLFWHLAPLYDIMLLVIRTAKFVSTKWISPYRVFLFSFILFVVL